MTVSRHRIIRTRIFLKYGFKGKEHLAQFFENLTDFKKGKKNNLLLKGQLISECLFDVLNFPKKQRKI